MNLTAAYLIDHYGMQLHPEGGYYAESYRSEEIIHEECLPIRFRKERNFSTAIYFLLEGDQYSAFHRIKSDEVWHFYFGSPLNIYVVDERGKFEMITLGNNPEKGQTFQAAIHSGDWFAAQPVEADNFSLVGCTVSPGFDFSDFELGDARLLIAKYPSHEKLIRRFTAQSV